MIPSEVVAIADLIAPGWCGMDDQASAEVIAAAYRIYNAGYRLTHAYPVNTHKR